MFVASAALQTVQAGSYLAKTGPTPLRIAPASSRTTTDLLPPLEMSDWPLVATNSAAIITNVPAPQETAVTNSLTNQISSASNTNANPDVLGPPNLEPFDNLPGASTPPTHVTPQMLVEYLMPLPGTTNGPQANVTVPAMIDFAPPMPHPRSQATYESK
jgi:hypothetical protein